MAEGFGEDGSGGEFVVGFVGVVEDEDPGCRFNGVHGKDVAETHRIGTTAVEAYWSPVRFRRGGGWEVIGGVEFCLHAPHREANAIANFFLEP